MSGAAFPLWSGTTTQQGCALQCQLEMGQDGPWNNQIKNRRQPGKTESKKWCLNTSVLSWTAGSTWKMGRKFILQAKRSLSLKYSLLNHNVKNTCSAFSCVGDTGMCFTRFGCHRYFWRAAPELTTGAKRHSTHFILRSGVNSLGSGMVTEDILGFGVLWNHFPRERVTNLLVQAVLKLWVGSDNWKWRWRLSPGVCKSKIFSV